MSYFSSAIVDSDIPSKKGGKEFVTPTGEQFVTAAPTREEIKARAPERGFFGAANDIVIEAANAAAGGVSSIANMISPGNRVSEFIEDEIIKPGEAAQSDQVKAEKKFLQQDLQNAQGAGDEITAYLGYMARNPGLAISQVAGSFAIPGLAAKGANLGARALGMGEKAASRFGLGAVSGVSGAMAGGEAGGSAYELVKRTPRKILEQNAEYQELLQSMDHESALEEIATRAARSASALPAVIGATLGPLGAERILAGAGRPLTSSRAKNAALTGGVDAFTEGLEEGVTTYEGQRAAAEYNPTIDPMKGVAGAATAGAVMGAGPGIALGALQAPAAPNPLQPVVDQAQKPGSVLSRAVVSTGIADQPAVPPAGPAAGSGAAIDPISARVSAVEADLRGNGTLEKIRGLTPEASNEFLYALNIAKNPNTRPDVREQAITQVEQVLETAKSGTAFTMVPPEKTEPSTALTVPGQQGGELAAQQGGPLAPTGMGQFFDPNVVDVDAVRVDNMLPGPRAIEGPRARIGTDVTAQPQDVDAPQQDVAPTDTPIETNPVADSFAPAEQQNVAEQTETAAAPEAPATPAVKPGAGGTYAGDPSLPAATRKRAATLRQLADQGFETVERRGNEFFLKNSKTGQELKLDGMADAQIARNQIKQAVDAKANTAAASPKNDRKDPTEAQIAAGNYKKSDVIDLNGMKIKIENPKDSIRRGVSPDGVMWETKMAHHYGEFQGTEGADGDKLDVFIGPRPDSNKVFVIDQIDPETGEFDESKVIMGATALDNARDIYLSNYEKGWGGLGAIYEVPLSDFKDWAKSRSAKRPIGNWLKQKGLIDARKDNTRNESGSDVQAVAERQGSLRKSEEPVLPQLRGQGNQNLQGVGGQLPGVSGGGRASSESAPLTGSNQQRRDVRAGQRALADQEGTGQQSAQEQNVDAQRQNANADAVGRGNGAGSVDASVSTEAGRDDGRASADNGTQGRQNSARGTKGSLGQFATLEEAKAYISQQRRANGTASGLPLQMADGSFGIAVKGSPQYAEAERQRDARDKPQGDFFTVPDGGKQRKLKKVSKSAMPKKASPRRMGEPRELTQDEAGLIEQVAAVLGKTVVFFEAQGERIGDGFFLPNQPGVLYVATETTVNPLAVFGHEFFHDLRETNPEAWNAIAAVVRTRVADPAGFRGDYTGQASADGSALTEQKGGELEELVSDLGGNLMMDPTFWRDVFAKVAEDNGPASKGIIARLAAALENLIARVMKAMAQPGFRAGEFVKEAEAIRVAYKDGLAGYIKAAGINKASMGAEVAKASQQLKKTPDRPAQPGSITVDGYHYSKQPRAVLTTGLFGTGLKGSARDEIMAAADDRIKQRLYFYVNKGTGISPEAGVGGYAHKATLTNIYDGDADPLRLKSGGARAFESKVLDAGFSGYLTRMEGTQSGQVILLGAQTVQPELLGTGKVTGAKVAPAPQQREQDAADRIMANKALPSGMLSPQRWSEVLMAQDPELAAQLLDIGAFDGTQGMYKDELAGKVRQLSSSIRKSADRAKSEYDAVVAQYKGTDQWLKAPNGEATELSERQWVQVRTPSFKAWFGDWEKHARAENPVDSLWSDDNVSKAVGKNSEPLVVYHGTDHGGFNKFVKPTGKGRGDLGIWTTPDYGMARSYVRKGRARDIELSADPTTKEELESFDYSFEEDDGDFGYTDTYGNFYNGFDSEESAVRDALDNFEMPDESGENPGIYALFINVRNPNEENFEGAMWNGERVDQYQVRDENDEPIYDSNGRGYFDRDTAKRLVEENPDSELQPADSYWNTTDDVVREALRSEQDGAIIREVIDDGGGPGYFMDPQDIFVAFDPTQVKSADYNNGEFSDSTGDLRRTTDRQYKLDIDREGRTVGKAARLTPEETQAIEADAKKYGLSAKQIKALVQSARDTKKQYPVAAGWAPIEVTGVTAKFDDDGAIKFDKDGNPQIEVKFREIGYAFNKPIGAKRAPPKMDQAWMNKVADKFGDLVMAIYRRAEKGDKNAQIIVGHQTWYRNVAEVLRREYGAQGDLLADLLGATSPNTPVDTNWRFSIDIMRRFVRGDFNADMEKFVEYLDSGGAPSQYPVAEKIRQVSGKLYGMNSGNAMRALADMWRVIEPGTAPKARNFALNLIGQSNMATIDVWAARMLRRAANMVRGADLPRIPPVAEKGVSGVWNADASEVTGEFGFGAVVMERVSRMLEKRGITVTPPDLQAIAWFAEKELWGSKGWTTKTGEGGSFEENIEAFPVERYLAGWSIQQGDKVPEQGQASLAQARVMSVLVGDDTVVAARVLPTTGLYGGTVEASFDTEWTAVKGQHDPSMAMAEIARIAKENDQYDIFVSRVVGPKEDNPNARPGVEIYFKSQRDLEAAMPVLSAFTSKGVDGFTMAVDPRAQTKSVAGEQFIGVRIQYVPEISMRWDDQARKDLLAPGGIEAAIEEKRKLLSDIAAEVRVMDGVAFAAMQNYDTVVVGKENYDEYIDRVAEGGDRETGNQAWFGSPVRQGLKRAATRLRGDVGQNGARGVSDAGGGVRASRDRGSRDGAGLDSGRSDSQGEGAQDGAGRLAPLPGYAHGNIKGAAGPDPRIVEVAEKYARDNGITLRRQAEYVKVDPGRAARIAAAYEAMPHDPQNPKVKEAFENLIQQTRDQYDALVDAGYEFTFFDSNSDPYQGNPWSAMRDLRANKRMAVYGTYDGYGTEGITAKAVDDNPMLGDTGLQWKDQSGQLRPVAANDLFRAVHDAFGHGLEGAGFRADGEENAWQAHARLFTGSAVAAITSETRGQNSWLNFGPYGETNRTAKLEGTVFAEQKTGLMPEWTWKEGVAGDMPGTATEPSYNQRIAALKDLITCLKK